MNPLALEILGLVDNAATDLLHNLVAKILESTMPIRLTPKTPRGSGQAWNDALGYSLARRSPLAESVSRCEYTRPDRGAL